MQTSKAIQIRDGHIKITAKEYIKIMMTRVIRLVRLPVKVRSALEDSIVDRGERTARVPSSGVSDVAVEGTPSVCTTGGDASVSDIMQSVG